MDANISHIKAPLVIVAVISSVVQVNSGHAKLRGSQRESMTGD